MLTIDPKTIPTRDLHQYLLGAVAPRPIAFASTIDENGNANIAPYSFFNAFSSNPPTLVFSANRRVVDNTTKDTLHNIETTKEVVINVVSHSIVRQMAVASIQFDTGVNEFEKSGLTPIASDLVKPFRIKESPVQMECRVREIITLGDKGGAGHLIICDVLRMHISENVIDNGRINPHKIDLVGRMGRAYYTRASGDAIFTVVQEVMKVSVGYDALPESVRNSHVLSGNDIGMLAGLHALPSPEEVADMKNNETVKRLIQECSDDTKALRTRLHHYAKTEIGKGNKGLAIRVLTFIDEFK